MQTAERQRLVSTLSHEPAYALGTVLKCGVCLAFLVLLAVIGNAREPASIAHEASKVAPVSPPVVDRSSAMAHRRQVFDERRARFMGNAPERDRGESSLISRTAAVAP